MVTTGAEPQKEMSKTQVEKAKESGIGGLVGLMADKTQHTGVALLAKKKMRETYNHHMADMVSDFYKDRQGQNE